MEQSSSGLPFAIFINSPPVPSRWQLSRQYHVAHPALCVEFVAELLTLFVKLVVSPHCPSQCPVFAVSTSADNIKQIVFEFIVHLPPLCL
jgi:hypothetical protein